MILSKLLKKKLYNKKILLLKKYIYFVHIKDYLNSASVYKYLTQDKTLELNKIRLIQFLLNINYKNIENIPNKDSIYL